MRILFSLLAAAAAGGLAIPASAADNRDVRAQARLTKALEGRLPGDPVRCISLSDIQSTEIIDHQAILYKTGGGRVYVNTPRFGREFLDDDNILVSQTWGSQLCNLDRVQPVRRGANFGTGYVALGEFIPYAKVKK